MVERHGDGVVVPDDAAGPAEASRQSVGAGGVAAGSRRRSAAKTVPASTESTTSRSAFSC